jgi:hypothetical protein
MNKDRDQPRVVQAGAAVKHRLPGVGILGIGHE